ncbi:MAG: GNAT family N-acetyltransferase [Alphaproteobacteria bacterium RIFCSPHIGHO2_12_FULL_63_12]|nr:MAG: GNAT family N-acetyltransferase [Alphaproteobacteria bacterium RIFCSPHIGHO2_12_FULL_63_12]
MENRPFNIRVAVPADIPAIRSLMARSIAELQKGFLTAAEIEASKDVMGLDTQLIEDGAYFAVVEAGTIVGCGGWSRRRTLFGGDHSAGRDSGLLSPETDAAKIRAMYTDPAHVRRGIGKIILAACEAAAKAAGFRRVEMAATLAGVPLYEACGYRKVEAFRSPTRSGVEVPLWRMAKDL